MEVIKITDVPQHLLNLEVLYILSQRIQGRRQQQDARFMVLSQLQQQQKQQQNGQESSTSKPVQLKNTMITHKKLLHRDFIEEKVSQYIRSTVSHHTNIYHTMNDNSGASNCSVSKTEQKDRHRYTFMSQTIPQFINKVTCKTKISTNAAAPAPAAGGGLTDMEILQVLNLLPTERVELHLILQHCDERFQQEQQDENKNDNNEDKLSVLLQDIQNL